ISPGGAIADPCGHSSRRRFAAGKSGRRSRPAKLCWSDANPVARSPPSAFVESAFSERKEGHGFKQQTPANDGEAEPRTSGEGKSRAQAPEEVRRRAGTAGEGCRRDARARPALAPRGNGRVVMRGTMAWLNEVKGHGYIWTDAGERLYVSEEGF